ncbi:MAG: hypothetical protein LVQ95_01220 [Candidatus Micrarchaeales archaeon]|nr:hypothetical protein [Candidatus Micrarchaeales archaeon]
MTNQIPKRIEETFSRLKLEYPFRIVLTKINDKYYVYRQQGIWQNEAKKIKLKSEYLGRIKEDGSFIKKKVQDKIKSAISLIEAAGGKVIMPEPQFLPRESTTMESGEKVVLTALSMNGRIPSKLIGKLVGISPQGAYHKVKRLEKKYGIKYLAEIDINKLGYVELMILIKFESAKPPFQEAKKAFEKYPIVQLCSILEGDYDLLLYVIVDKDREKADSQLAGLRSGALQDYSASWHIKPVFPTYGYIPLRESFFDVLKERVWMRKKLAPRPTPDNLLLSEFTLLKELNFSGDSKFNTLDKRYNFEQGRANYTFRKLKERGIIKRITITMSKVPIRYVAVVLMNRVNEGEFDKTRKYLRLHTVEETDSPTNRYSFRANIDDPDGVISFLNVYDKNELDETLEKLQKTVAGVKFSTSMISSTLIGQFCYRKFDNRYTIQYKNLVEIDKLLQRQEVPKYDK